MKKIITELNSSILAATPTAIAPIYGTAGNDVIVENRQIGGLIYGGAGNDTIKYTNTNFSDVSYSFDSNIGAYGGDGNDTFISVNGYIEDSDDGHIYLANRNYFFGGAGADNFTGGYAVYQGNQGLIINTFDNTMNTGEAVGDVFHHGVNQITQIVGTAGHDKIYAERASGGSGNDIMYGGENGSILVGDSIGSLYPNAMAVIDGNDRLIGGAGEDALFGGGGNDRLQGMGGMDRLYGGNGNNVLDGGAGNDILSAYSGNNTMYGGLGNDDISATSGVNMIYGGAGNDEIELEPFDLADNNTVYGGSGDDKIYGGWAYSGLDGKSTIYGGNGNDEIEIGNGGSVSFGGRGNDIFNIAMYQDSTVTVTGGAGSDNFVFGSGGDLRATATILDYNASLDHLIINGIEYRVGVARAGITYQDTTVGVVIDSGGNDQIILSGYHFV